MTGRLNKIVKTARVIGFAVPTCTDCLKLLHKYYGAGNISRSGVI